MNNLIRFIELLRQDMSMVDTYDALDDDELRVGWFKDQIFKLDQIDPTFFDMDFNNM